MGGGGLPIVWLGSRQLRRVYTVRSPPVSIQPKVLHIDQRRAQKILHKYRIIFFITARVVNAYFKGIIIKWIGHLATLSL